MDVQQNIGGRQHGFSLVSTMIGMTLSLFIVAGVIGLVVSASRGNQRMQDSVLLIESGRYATHRLREELEHAGFYGGLFPLASENWPAIPLLMPDPCLVTNLVTVITGMPMAVQGYDNSAGDPAPSCISDEDHLDGTDIIFVRRSDVEVTAAGDVEAGHYYLQANAFDYQLGLGVDINPLLGGFGLTQYDPVGTTVATPIRLFHVDGYYISPRSRPVSATACDGDETDPGDAVPTLMRLRLQGLQFCAEPLAHGIENLQIEYGIDDNLNGTPDRYTEDPGNNIAWANVVSARLFLLARSREARGGQEIRRFQLGEGVAGPDGTDTFIPPDDNFTRHVFSTTAQLTNVSGRRETP